MDELSYSCFNCGQPGHLKANCTRPAPGAARPGNPTPTPPPMPPRRPEGEIADAAKWAEAIRHDLGWLPLQGEEHNRRIAREQVIQSRALRAASTPA